MDNQNSIKSYYYQLIDIFNEDKIGRLIVPDYQRGFDWSQSHVDDLWEDLKYYLEKEINGERDDFYVGSIILKEPDEHSNRYEIVDGQQRLTSFYLLCIAMRQKFKEFDKHNETRDIDRDFLNIYDDELEREPKLLGTKKIREFLRFISKNDWNNIFPSKENYPDMNGNTINSINRILKTSLQSHQQELNEICPDKSYEKTLISLYKVIRRIKISVLTVETFERAFYLFETTNARGKALEPGDLLKNHLFRTIPESKRDDIYERWEGIVEQSCGKLILMLKHFYYVQHKHVQKKDLYRKLKQLDDSETLLKSIESYSKFHFLMHKGSFKDFEEYFYHDLKIFEHSQEEKKIENIMLSIRALRLFKSELTYPVIYAFLTKYSELIKEESILKDKNKRRSFTKQLITIFKAFENFQFINYKICSNKGNIIEIPYAKFAGKIYRSKDVADFLTNIEDLYTFMRTGVNSFNIFEDEFSQISYLDDKNRKLIHYIFHKIEEYRTGNLVKPIFNPEADSKLYDIEHWAPKDLTTHSNSQEEYAEYQEIHEKIIEDDLIHSIGNLASCHNTLNQLLSNKIPRVKEVIVKENKNSQNLIINNYLEDFFIDNGIWTSDEIINRSKNLAKECYEKIFAIGENVNFPKITDQVIEKF